MRPPEARQKPKVSAYINAKFDKILSLKPDLVFAFSDLQADIAAELIRRGVTVFTFNQRSIVEIMEMILTIGRIVGSAEKAERNSSQHYRATWMRLRHPHRAFRFVRVCCLKSGTTRSSPAFAGLTS